MREKFLSQEEIYLFNKGEFKNSYLKFGAHIIEYEGIMGVHYAVWAPNAQAVSVVGDFNDWDGKINPLSKREGGVWDGFIPYVQEGERYKYQIITAKGEALYKCDPYAFWSELRPNTASVVCNLENKYQWKDGKWYKEQMKTPPREKKMLIYEVHPSSWGVHGDGSWYTYKDMAKYLLPYVKEMGFTHIEMMPLTEHPFDGSWGYQTTGYYSATSRYGKPEELMFFIDACHGEGIGVIMDWVPGHFCMDAHGLGLFDGTPCYEKEVHFQWGTYKFDFDKTEVRGFLISNALFWIEKFHFDGLRVDGVSSMLYLDFDRVEFEPNIDGGRENLGAISFLRALNNTVISDNPNAMMIAEESTNWPMVTKPDYDGGLGFTFKWNMGWMNDTLKYIETPFEERRNYHNLLTFSLVYTFSEEFILPFSHDEVVHGKCSLINKMPGDNWQKFAGYRALYLYQMTHPGKKLLFMGSEFAQYIEWKYYESLEWFMLKYPLHNAFKEYVKVLNNLYQNSTPLWKNDSSWETFQWLDANNNEQSVIAYERKDNEGNAIIVIINFKPKAYDEFRVGVPHKGRYAEIFNSDNIEFGGAGFHKNGIILSEKITIHGKENSITVKLPPLGGTILKVPKIRKNSKSPT